MKKLFFIFSLGTVLFTACQGEQKEEILLDSGDTETIQEVVDQFAEGKAATPGDYFNGIVGAVVDVDIKLREIAHLDEMDASEKDITHTLNLILEKIEVGRAAINLYQDKDWQNRDKFHNMTMTWFEAVEGLVNNHLFALAEPMSRLDETWSEEELLQFEEYNNAYNDYLEIDLEWVDVEIEFAEIHQIELGERMDIDAIAEEETENLP